MPGSMSSDGAFCKMLNFFALKPKYLNKDAITNIYYNFSAIKQSSDYRIKILENQISEINNFGKEGKLVFSDFDFIISENKSIKISELIKDKEYAVLYFWFSSCGPSRSFN